MQKNSTKLHIVIYRQWEDRKTECFEQCLNWSEACFRGCKSIHILDNTVTKGTGNQSLSFCFIMPFLPSRKLSLTLSTCTQGFSCLSPPLISLHDSFSSRHYYVLLFSLVHIVLSLENDHLVHCLNSYALHNILHGNRENSVINDR